MKFGPPGAIPELFTADGTINELRSRLPQSATEPIAFVGGSLIDGLGNSTSDIDVIVLSGDPLNESDLACTVHDEWVSAGDFDVLVSSLGGRRTDVEIRQVAQIEGIATKLRTDSGRLVDFYLETDILQLLHSMRIGVPIAGAERFTQLRNGFPWENLSWHLLSRAEAEAAAAVEDAVGALDAGDHGTALLASRTAWQAAVDALLVAAGETNPKSKWRVRKIERSGIPGLMDDYLQWETDPDSSPTALLSRARARLYRAQDLLLSAQSEKSGRSGVKGTW
ncbi:hypothetical protein [Amycolatopsis saalfeldensis]|uniref:Nucleotidyltransferase domain-containing protein n=1 Tax=Amycolatopsis saalfeldensis TaxID=394193 RepID=A0A1H8Y870_9PSEU|nr:hypothetical protein [Amycolatopsis saalfeldensis]SEP48345.1 hypothetical protein SAMN04489732_1127 [Amycolatopsis saalfeldensis]